MPANNESLGRALYGSLRPTTVTTASLADGLLIPDSSPNLVSPATALTQAGADTGTAGVKFTHIFKYRFPNNLTTAARIRARLRWELSGIGAGAGSTGRMNVYAKKSGASISGLTKGNGATRALDAGAGTLYDEEQIAFDLPASQSFVPGDTLDIAVEFEVVNAVAGAQGVILHVDPSSPSDSLIVELDGYEQY